MIFIPPTMILTPLPLLAWAPLPDQRMLGQRRSDRIAERSRAVAMDDRHASRAHPALILAIAVGVHCVLRQVVAPEHRIGPVDLQVREHEHQSGDINFAGQIQEIVQTVCLHPWFVLSVIREVNGSCLA